MTDGEPQGASVDEVRGLVGDIEQVRIDEIIASGATVGDIEIALAWAAGESDVMGEERKPLAGRAARVYAIVFADEEFPEEA